MSDSVFDRLGALCLALPESEERGTWDRPTFRVRDRIFAMATERDGRKSFCCKAPPGSQAVLVGADPERFYRPPYAGTKGWVGVWLEPEPDWVEIAEFVKRSYRLVAPRRLATRLD